MGFNAIIQNKIALDIAKERIPEFPSFNSAFVSTFTTVKLGVLFQSIVLIVRVSIGLLSILAMGTLQKINSISPVSSIAVSLLLIPIAISLIILFVKLSLSWFILVENPFMKMGDVLRKSIFFMRKNEIKFLFLMLPFIGWVVLMCLGIKLINVSTILGVLALIGASIGFLYLHLYVRVSFAEFYLSLTRAQEVENTSRDETMLK